MLDFFSDLIGDSDPNSDFIEYEEKSSDFFAEVVVNGNLPYHNTTLTVKTYESRSSKKLIDSRCKWFRVVDSRNYEIRDNPIDDTYHINAYDIGSYLKVAVKVKGVKQVTIIKVGPILLNPKMIPSLENTLLSNEGVFNFALLKYGEKFVDDKSEFQNFIKFSQEKIMVKFGFYFQHEYPDFELNLNGPYDYKIFCENHDPRAISIFFIKGTESMLSENIVIPSPVKRKKYEKLEKEYREKANQQMNPAGVELFDKSDDNLVDDQLMKDNDTRRNLIHQDDEFTGNEFEFRIRFSSRLNRDAFICAVRVISIMKTMAMAPLIDHTDKVFSGTWKMPEVGEQINEYNKLVGQMYDMGGAIYRVLNRNKALRKDNINLVKCVDLLESKLKYSFIEFQRLLQEIRDTTPVEELQRMERVNKSLMDTSMRAKKIKEEGNKKNKKKMINTVKNSQSKAKGLQREIESTNKLNNILLKEINKLKKDGGSPRKGNFKKKTDPVNATVIVGRGGNEDNRLNLSGMGKREGDQYLIGLEDQIEDKMKKVASGKKPKNDEEKMLLDAIGNMEQKSDREIIQTKLEKSNIKEQDYQEDDKLGAIVELELEKEMLLSSLKNKTKRFEDLITVSSQLSEGKAISEISVEGINLDIERIFDTELSHKQIKNLQKAVLIKYAESEINQLKLLQESKGQNLATDFETFQKQGNFQGQASSQQTEELKEATKKQFLQDIEDLEEENRGLEKKNMISKTKLENLRKQVEKMQQQAVDDMANEEDEDEEDDEIKELERSILELEEKKKGMLAIA